MKSIHFQSKQILLKAQEQFSTFEKTPTFEMDSENSNLTLEYWVYFVKQLPDKNVTLRVGVTSCKGLWKEE